ncbi:amidohydrolase [Edwardsiella tarda]|uniref:amidohydrolase n=1 Tax=Edwardsiella tarda TaxID=636 RepID=UPI00030DDB14|nr:amidohydrolase [Edwardsiella tarda]
MKMDNIAFRLIDMTSPVTLFLANKVITMDPAAPFAECVASQHGTIVAVGQAEMVMKALALHHCAIEVDDRFREYYIYPGFSEHHMHPHMMGAFLRDAHYIGYVDRKGVDGTCLPGIQSVDALLERLRQLLCHDHARLASSATQWLNCWGFDPLLLNNADVSRDVLDQVSTEFPICLSHASGHVINVNSRALTLCGYEHMPADPNLFCYEDGRLNGTIAELAMMQPAFANGAARMDFSLEGLLDAGEIATRIARIHGCTSITDKGTNVPVIPENMAAEAWIKGEAQKRLHTRVIMEPWFSTIERWRYKTWSGWEAVEALRNEYHPRLSVGNYKLLADGSIQAFTAHLLPDQSYVTPGKPNGLLLMDADEMAKHIALAESHGMSCSIHTNGNGATEAALEAIAMVRTNNPNPGFRHSLEHCQLATENQFYRMAKLGVTPNLFANHLYFWGDVHCKYTVGPHGVRRMDACCSATRYGLKHGVHSDDMVTEVAPLFSAWCAVNRRSLTGVVYGEDQCLTVDEAMRVITYNHAWLAHQDDVRGSIELGKWADFTVLEEEATEAVRERLKDIRIIGTVIGGDDIMLN